MSTGNSATTTEANEHAQLIIDNLVPAMRLLAMLDFRLASAADAVATDEDDTLRVLAESAREHLRDALRDIRRMRLVLETQEQE